MRSQKVWRKIFGWSVGDFFKFYAQYPSGKVKWIRARIVGIKDEYFLIRALEKYPPLPKIFGIDREDFKTLYPLWIKDYFPHKKTIQRFEEERMK